MEPGPLMLIALLGAHFYFDYAGQGDFMARAKNENAAIPGVPWETVIWSHAAIHGAAVALITGLPILFLAETGIHASVDRAKCRGLISFNVDQLIHIGCKFIWVGLAWRLA